MGLQQAPLNIQVDLAQRPCCLSVFLVTPCIVSTISDRVRTAVQSELHLQLQEQLQLLRTQLSRMIGELQESLVDEQQGGEAPAKAMSELQPGPEPEPQMESEIEPQC